MNKECCVHLIFPNIRESGLIQVNLGIENYYLICNYLMWLTSRVLKNPDLSRKNEKQIEEPLCNL